LRKEGEGEKEKEGKLKRVLHDAEEERGIELEKKRRGGGSFCAFGERGTRGKDQG